MYQYKAILKSTKEVIAENHSKEQIMHDIKHFKREQAKNIHTHGNDQIEIYHTFRDGSKDKLIKVV